MFGRSIETEVLVVGAGPVGLFAALLLARRGIKVRVVDEQWRTTARSYALALHPHTLALLEEADLAAELVAAGRRISKIGLYDDSGRLSELDLGGLGARFPYLLVLPQSALESVLEDWLEQAGVEILWNHRLASLDLQGEHAVARVERLEKESTGYSVTTTEWVVKRTLRVESSYVLGADGHHSAVRRELGIGFPEVGPAQQFAVFECTATGPVPQEMRVVLGEGRTSVYWPLDTSRFRWSFELGADEGPEPGRTKGRLAVQIGERPYPYLAPERLSALLAERAPWFEATVEEIHWSVGVRFERRLAERFGRGVAFLAGDAAHLAGPIGVHSMNAGLEEAEALAGCVAGVLRQGVSAAELDEVRRQRRASWQRLQALESAAPAAGAPQWLLRHGARIPACVPASGRHLTALLSGLGLVV